MATLVATAQNATLQGESTAQQRTPPAILARRSVTGSRNAGSLTRPRMPTKDPSHSLNGNMEEEEGQMNQEFRKETPLLMKS